MYLPNRVRLLITAAAIALTSAAPAQGADPDPLELLQRSLNPGQVSFTGEQTVVTAGGSGGARRKAAQARVYRQGAVLRVEYANGQILLDDGSSSRLYLPRQRLVEQGPSRSAGARATLQRAARAGARARSHLELLESGQVAGRPAYLVAVRLPRQPKRLRRVWIDKETGVQLRMDEERPDGRSISTFFTRIEFGVDIPAEKLRLDLPPGVLTVNQGEGRPISKALAAQLAQRWGGLRLPSAPPAGFRLRRFYRHTYRGRPAVVAVYEHEGGRSVSLFQGPGFSSPQPVSSARENLRVLSARRGEAELTLVGALPEDQMRRMLDSVP